VPDLPADAGTSDELEERLALTQRVCDFAVTALNLPDNASHRRCADLQRGAAVRDVVVAPELPAPLRADHVALKASARQGYIGYDGRFAQVNNASFGVLAACTERMPHFERLLVAQGGDLLRLYALGSAPRGLSDGRAAATPAGSGFRLIGVNAFP
jgi:predicted aminopeptidase